tara:strand:- start:793 stop:1005 length:213 start_codon:yes stop_codon:yes gene_type:complete
MKEKIAKYQGLANGYERIQTYQKILARHLKYRARNIQLGLSCAYIDKHIARDKFRIKRVSMLTDYLENNY